MIALILTRVGRLAPAIQASETASSQSAADSRRVLRQGFRNLRAAIGSIVAEGGRDGDFAPVDPDLAALAILGSVRMAAHARIGAHELSDAVADLFINGLRAAEARSRPRRAGADLRSLRMKRLTALILFLAAVAGLAYWVHTHHNGNLYAAWSQTAAAVRSLAGGQAPDAANPNSASTPAAGARQGRGRNQGEAARVAVVTAVAESVDLPITRSSVGWVEPDRDRDGAGPHRRAGRRAEGPGRRGRQGRRRAVPHRRPRDPGPDRPRRGDAGQGPGDARPHPGRRAPGRGAPVQGLGVAPAVRRRRPPTRRSRPRTSPPTRRRSRPTASSSTTRSSRRRSPAASASCA